MFRSILDNIWILLILSFLLACSEKGKDVAGGGSETDNPAMISGRLFYKNGTPAANAIIHIRQKNTLADTSGVGLHKVLADTPATVTTNDTGVFAIDSINPGLYVVEGAKDSSMVLIDSVAVISQDSTVTLPPDTLKPAGALKGIIYLSEGGDPRKVFILAFGIDRFASVNADGSFKFSNLAEGTYNLRFISSLDNYMVLDTFAISVISSDTTSMDTIRLPFTGIPTPKNVSIAYDTLRQIVTLTWAKADSNLVKGYNLYRRNVDSNTVLTRINTTPISTTLYLDSTVVQDMTYEYKVTAISPNDMEGTKSIMATTLIATYFHLDSIYGGSGSAPGLFSYPSDIVLRTDGDIYIVDHNNNRVQVFDSSMQYKREFGQGILNRPYKIAVDSSNNVYVSTSDTVFVFDPFGVITDTIPIGNLIFDLALEKNKLFVISDGDSINEFSLDGLIIRSWQCGEYNSTDWLIVLDSNRIVTSDHEAEVLKVFDTLGNIISTIPASPYPGCIESDPQRRLFINYGNDISGQRLKVITADQLFVLADYRYKNYSVAGEPMAITVSPTNIIYVALGTTNTVLKLSVLLP